MENFLEDENGYFKSVVKDALDDLKNNGQAYAFYQEQVEDFVVYSDGSNGLMLVAKPQRCTYGAVKDPNPGRLKNCSFKDLRVVGKKGFEGLIYLRGNAPQWDVDGIRMENVTYFGEPVTQNSPCVRVDGEFVKNFEIK